ncbi:MAG: preprotein translocase subunit Sec61beta [Candidatus Woesearchaeota archaeon]
MAKDNKVRMPSSMAGITQYYDGDQSKIMITPKHVMILIAGVALIVLALHAFL